MTINNLYTADFAFNTPFQLNLADGGIFFAEKVVRIIPKRRMVVFGTWNNKPVVAKLFFDKKRAKHHQQKDLSGIKILQTNKIPTPELYYEGVSADGRCYVLLLEKIVAAKNIEELWHEKQSLKAIMPQLKLIMVEIATQHVLGILQHDLHLKNFLLTDKIIYTLDGAQIEYLQAMVAARPSFDNIAMFLSQLGVGVEEYQQELFYHYTKARSLLIKDKDIQELFLLIKKWSNKRWQRYEKKLFRECTDFSLKKRFSSVSVYDRHYSGPEFIHFIQHPESAFNHVSTKILKDGRSSTVVKVTLDQRDFVVKRHNVKNIMHFLRRCLRSTRALHAWRLAQKLKLFHIATANPAAFIEKRFLGLRSKSYYVMEYIPGQHMGEFFIQHAADNNKLTSMIKRVAILLKRLSQLGITHGDLKATNILINHQDQPLLIDLDGAAEHVSHLHLRKAWHKEIKRFLKNFINEPETQTKFKSELNLL